MSLDWVAATISSGASFRDTDPSYVVNIETSPEGNFWIIPASGQWTSSSSYSTITYIYQYIDVTATNSVAFYNGYWVTDTYAGHPSGVIQVDKDYAIPLSPVKARAAGSVRYTPAVYRYKENYNPSAYLTMGYKGNAYFGDSVGNNGVFSSSYEAAVKNDPRSYRGYSFKMGGCLIMTYVPSGGETTIYWTSLNLLGMRYSEGSPIALDTANDGGGSGTTSWFELSGYPILKSNGVGLLSACGSRMKTIRGYGWQGGVGGAWPNTGNTAPGQFAVPM
jgi:hypothetical protein